MKPKVSVIIPVYNSQDYIENCIQSVLNQTLKNFEIILIDDGSDDKSSEICDEYQEKYETIKVIHKNNEGVSIARNVGIDIAKGEYITFLDSDDYLESTFLEYGIKKIEEYDSDLFISGISMETYNNKDIIRIDNYTGKEKKYTVKSLLENLEVEYPLICISGPWCKLYKSSILNKYNIKFNKNLDLGEDTYFNLDYLNKIKDVYFSNNQFYCYRRANSNSLFSRYHKNNYEIHLMIYSKMRTLYNKLNCSEESLIKFDNMYINLLIGCIHYEFRHNSLRKKNIIKTIVNNEFIRNYNTKHRKKDLKNDILLYLLKTKNIFILNLIFNTRYIRGILR